MRGGKLSTAPSSRATPNITVTVLANVAACGGIVTCLFLRRCFDAVRIILSSNNRSIRCGARHRRRVQRGVLAIANQNFGLHIGIFLVRRLGGGSGVTSPHSTHRHRIGGSAGDLVGGLRRHLLVIVVVGRSGPARSVGKARLEWNEKDVEVTDRVARRRKR